MPDPTSVCGAREGSVRLGATLALDSVSVEVPAGQVVAIVGGDGAGKTTLQRTLIGRVEAESGTVWAPPPRELGYLPSASGTWRQLTVDENLDLVAHAYSDRPRDLDRRRDELLDASGLADARTRLAGQLSGGMRQKLGFCMAMLHGPRLVVLDEPSTGVDPVSRVELWSLIADAAASGTAVVLATTYLDEAERVHDVVVLDAGRVLLHGSPAEVLAASPGTVSLVTTPDNPARAWRRGRAVHEWHAGPPAPGDSVLEVDLEDAVIAAALDIRGDAVSRSTRPASPRRALDRDAALASTSHVSRAFADQLAVDDVTIEVRPGEIVGLIGANGAGKTTLIRMVLGVLPPSGGTVQLFGADPSRESRRRLGYVPQGLGLYGDLTVDENLAFVASAYDATSAADDALRGGDALVAVRGELVGGIGLGRQRQLAFACALAHSPDLLVLDEPTSGVDAISRARLWDTVHDQAEAGAGLLVSTHYMQEAEQCDRLVLMDLGRVVASGTVAEIVAATRVVEVATSDWASAFAALRAVDLPVALAGTAVRVVDTDAERVHEVLRDAGVGADVRPARATLDETMTAISRGRRTAARA